jgi:hypothetical protein
VLFPDRSGVPGASVAFGPIQTLTDGSGSFELDLRDDVAVFKLPGATLTPRHLLDGIHGAAALVAWLDGWVPALIEDFGERVRRVHERSGHVLEPVELVLPSQAAAIEGVLLDRFGRPAEGWRQMLLDGTPAYADDYRPFTAEELATGATSHVELGPEGAFRFQGLMQGKRYRMRFWDQHTLAQLVTEPILAGTSGLVLRAPGEAWRPLVDGVAVGLDGSPLAGITCRLSMVEYAHGGGTWMTTGQEVVTDEFGRFAFVDVPPAPVFIRFNGQGVGQRFDLDPDSPGRDLRCELVRTGDFVFERTTAGPSDLQLRALDDSGVRLHVEVFTALGTSSSSRDVAIAPGTRIRASVSEAARWLVLVPGEGQHEVARLPILIRHGEEAFATW